MLVLSYLGCLLSYLDYFFMGSNNVFRWYRMCDLFIFTTFIITFTITFISIIDIKCMRQANQLIPFYKRILENLIIYKVIQLK